MRCIACNPESQNLQEKFSCTMEISSVATEGVSLCGDSARVGDRAFRNLVQVTVEILLKKKSEESLKS